MSKFNGAATANVANGKTLIGYKAELELRKKFPNLYGNLMSEKTAEEKTIEAVLNTFSIDIEKVEVKRANDYSEFMPKGRFLGSKANDEGLVAQINRVQFLAPYAMVESLKEFNQEMLEFETKTMEKRDLETVTAEESFIRDMDYFVDEKGKQVSREVLIERMKKHITTVIMKSTIWKQGNAILSLTTSRILPDRGILSCFLLISCIVHIAGRTLRLNGS